MSHNHVTLYCLLYLKALCDSESLVRRDTNELICNACGAMRSSPVKVSLLPRMQLRQSGCMRYDNTQPI